MAATVDWSIHATASCERHLPHCNKLESRPLLRLHCHVQVLTYQSDVLSPKQQNKRLQEANQRLLNLF